MILQTIHKYRRTLVGFTILFLMALSLSGLGLDAIRNFNDPTGPHALKVNDRVVSFSEFAKLNNQGKRDPQQLIDSLISSSLIEQTADKLGFNAGKDSIIYTVQEEWKFSPEIYRAMLQQTGMTAREFEGKIKNEAKSGELIQLLSDVSFASDKEARLRLELDETTYNADYLEFAPESFIAKTEAPSNEAMETYYNEHSENFEVEAGVSYDYVIFTPAEYLKSVEVSPDDIELYYADHDSEFATPESVKARHIRLLYPKDSKAEQMLELKEKANQVYSRVQAGESFDALALEFSDDSSTSAKGGDLGWINRGKMSKEFDAAAFKMKASGLAELISADYGFQIVRVDEYKESGTKPLDEVKATITEEIQKRDAPIYAANRAQELLEEWKKGTLSLNDFASQRGLKVASTNGIMTKDMDPETLVKGLTATVIPMANDEKQIANLDDFSALVHVTKVRETDIAPLAEVKEKIITTLRATSAKTLARKAAEDVIEKIKQGTYKNLAAAAVGEKLNKQSATALQRTKPAQGLFADKGVQKALYATYSPEEKPAKVFENAGKYYLFQVTSITKPAADTLDKKLPSYKDQESYRISNTFLQSVINQLKKGADIDINPQALAQE